MIKLLALDLDGTLLNPEGEISERNKSAIRRAEEMGILVTIASGRRFRDARPIALEIGLNAPIVTHNGGLTKFAGTIETVASRILNTETANRIIEVGKEHGFEPLVSIDPVGSGSLIYERGAEENLHLEGYLDWSRSLHGDDAEESIFEVENLFSSVISSTVIHISYSGNCKVMSNFAEILNVSLDINAEVLATVYPKLDFTLLDILPPDTSKGHALDTMARTSGFSKENVMVIGDNFNDIEMLEYAGFPVVMGNADSSLLEREEFYTTSSNENDGVADAIERFIFGDKND